MKDDVHELLSALPRERAGAGFTRRVVVAAAQPRRRARRFQMIAAAAASLALVLALGRQVQETRRERDLERLRAQHRAIAAELQKLKEVSRDLQPVVYLGSSDNTDYVLDLRPRRAATVQPVANEY